MMKSMKRICFAFLLPLLGCGTQAGKFSLPSTWTDDLSISVYHGGGMLYQSLQVIYTADSGKYDSMNQGQHRIHEFVLSAQDKRAILDQLHEYGLGRVWSIPTTGKVYDKETTRICVMQKSAKYCVESSAAKSIAFNESGFSKSYDYLVEFAKQKQATK